MLIGREKCPVDADGCGRGQGYGHHQARAKVVNACEDKNAEFIINRSLSVTLFL